MDDHRDQYHEAKAIWLEQIQLMLNRLSKYDAKYEHVNPKKTIFRINNNRMFHPDKPVYKNNFAFSPSSKEEPSFYLQVSPSNSFIGGGMHRPDSKTLKQIRSGIDYDGHELVEMINKKSFVNFYGGLSPDPEKLKTSPRGYNQDHKHIDLLRHRNFTATRVLTHKEVTSSDFIDIVEKGFVEIQDFNAYLQRAMSFEE